MQRSAGKSFRDARSLLAQRALVATLIVGCTAFLVPSSWAQRYTGAHDAWDARRYAPFAGWGIMYNRASLKKISYWSSVLAAWVEWPSATQINDTAWHHIAVTVANTTVTFYLDGVSMGAATSNRPGNYTGAKAIGAISGGGSNFFDGTLDEPMIFSRALGDSEVRRLYFAGKDEFTDYGLRTAAVVDTMPIVTIATPHDIATIVGPHNTALIAHD